MSLTPPSGHPPPTPAPTSTSGSRLAVLAVGGLVALFVVAFVVGVRLSEGDDAGDDGGAATETAAAVLSESDLDALVEELSGYVEEQRGLRFRHDVDVEVLDTEDYRDRVLADAEDELDDEGLEDLVQTAGAYQALGLWPAGTDPEDVFRQFTSVSSLGFYDPVEHELVVLGAANTPNLRLTLVHELTHALDDQHFDLGRLEDLAGRPDESASSFRALVEGNASRVETVYEDTLSDDERHEVLVEQMAQLGDVDLSDIPPILFATQEQIYTSGEAFVDALFDEGGNEAIDDALRHPPTTSEQILEPEDWPERDPIVEVAEPEADGEVILDGSVGQAFLTILVHGVFSGGDDVPEWDGDNSVVWADGDEFCVRFAIAGDEEGWEEALGSWADDADADLTIEDDLLVATSCG